MDFEKGSYRSFTASIVFTGLKKKRKWQYYECSTSQELYKNIWLNICNKQSVWKMQPFFVLLNYLATIFINTLERRNA